MKTRIRFSFIIVEKMERFNKKEIVDRLQGKFSSFLDDSNSFIMDLAEGPYRIAMLKQLAQYEPLRFERNHLEEVLFRTKSIVNPTIGRLGIQFKLDGIVQTPWETQERTLGEYYDILNSCLNEFWSSKKHLEKFDSLGHFSLFEERMFDSPDEYKSFMTSRRGSIINEKAWLNYTESIITEIYSNFEKSTSLSNATDNYFIRPLGDDLHLGLRYNIKALRKELKRGNLMGPKMEVVFIDDFGKPDFSAREEILLCKYSHPLLGGIMDVRNYYAYIRTTSVGSGSFDIRPLHKKEETKEGMLRVFEDETFGLQLKKYFFYQMTAEMKVNEPFLEYLSGSIR